MLSVKVESNTIFFESLVWVDLVLNPDLPDHWRTLCWSGQWPGNRIIIILYLVNFSILNWLKIKFFMWGDWHSLLWDGYIFSYQYQNLKSSDGESIHSLSRDFFVLRSGHRSRLDSMVAWKTGSCPCSKSSFSIPLVQKKSKSLYSLSLVFSEQGERQCLF